MIQFGSSGLICLPKAVTVSVVYAEFGRPIKIDGADRTNSGVRLFRVTYFNRRPDRAFSGIPPPPKSVIHFAALAL